MTSPELEPAALIIIYAFRPATCKLEGKSFVNQRAQIAYIGLLRKIATEAHAALAIAESKSIASDIAPHSPIVVLSRSILEAAGQFAHWFLNPIPDNQLEFELLAAEIAGEQSRLKHVPQVSRYEEMVRQNRSFVDALIEEAEQHSYWVNLKTSEQEKVKNGMWKAIGKGTLPSKLGYGPNTLAGLYSWMSDGSHGGMRLLKQLVQKDPEIQRYKRASLNYVVSSMALLLHRLAEKEPQVESFVTEHDEVRRAIELYYSNARN